MKVAYIFTSQGHTVSYKLGQMILPQLETDGHGVDVAGMFFLKTTIMFWLRAIHWASDLLRLQGTRVCC